VADTQVTFNLAGPTNKANSKWFMKSGSPTSPMAAIGVD
jgi:hypothetical protein